MKNIKGWMFFSWLVLSSGLLAPLAAFSQGVQGQGKDYAVEVAALASRDCADELVKGLVSRGLDAYWLKTNQGKLGEYYRVRVGKFPDLDLARNFADSLLDSGLLDTCSITVYEAPLYSLMMKDGRGQNTLPLLGQRNTPIGSYCPLNLAEKDSNKPEAIISSLANGPNGVAPRSPLSGSDEAMKKAIDAVIASTQASMSSIRPKVNLAINLTTLDAGINKAVTRQAIERELAARNPKTAAPEIRLNRPASSAPRVEKSSFAGTGSAGLGSGPRLRGFIEMNNGRMLLKLRNLDSERGFSGLARITLSDDNDFNNDAAPLPVDLQPDEEKVLPINETKKPYGDLMLMVYDQRKTVQLIRSIPYGERPKAAIAANRSESNPAQFPQSSDGDSPPASDAEAWKIKDAGAGAAVDVPGGFPNVTGSFDATRLPDPATGALPGAPSDNNSNPAQTSGSDNPQQQVPISISPRQISSNSDSVTMEVGLAGSQPIGYVKVSIKAGGFTDEKVAVFPYANASVPFLIPAKDAKGQYTYEVRNEAGTVIGTGVQNFTPPGPDS